MGNTESAPPSESAQFDAQESPQFDSEEIFQFDSEESLQSDVPESPKYDMPQLRAEDYSYNLSSHIDAEFRAESHFDLMEDGFEGYGINKDDDSEIGGRSLSSGKRTWHETDEDNPYYVHPTASHGHSSRHTSRKSHATQDAHTSNGRSSPAISSLFNGTKYYDISNRKSNVVAKLSGLPPPDPELDLLESAEEIDEETVRKRRGSGRYQAMQRSGRSNKLVVNLSPSYPDQYLDQRPLDGLSYLESDEEFSYFYDGLDEERNVEDLLVYSTLTTGTEVQFDREAELPKPYKEEKELEPIPAFFERWRLFRQKAHSHATETHVYPEPPQFPETPVHVTDYMKALIETRSVVDVIDQDQWREEVLREGKRRQKRALWNHYQSEHLQDTFYLRQATAIIDSFFPDRVMSKPLRHIDYDTLQVAFSTVHSDRHRLVLANKFRSFSYCATPDTIDALTRLLKQPAAQNNLRKILDCKRDYKPDFEPLFYDYPYHALPERWRVDPNVHYDLRRRGE